MKKLTMISLIIACASATLNAATPAEEVKALQEVITSNLPRYAGIMSCGDKIIPQRERPIEKRA